jgi:hypothetical protein
MPDKMNKSNPYILTLFLAISAVAISSVSAQTFSDNGDGTATLTDYPRSITGAVEIPSSYNGLSVTSIGPGAFSNCSSLTSVTISDGVVSIGSGTFEYCYALKVVVIPPSVSVIDQFAFSNCRSLESITIPEGITILRSFLFQNCYSLTSIKIPASVTYVAESFYNCSALTDIEFEGSVAPEFGGSSFVGVSSQAIIRHPYGATGYPDFIDGVPTTGGRLLSVGASVGGSTDMGAESFFDTGSAVAISAIPDTGYVFTAWSGGRGSISDNPLTFNITEDTTLTPVFNQDTSDVDGDGLSAFEELITYGTNPNLKDSNSDGLNDADVVSGEFDPATDYTKIIAYIHSSPGHFGLYDSTSILDANVGNAMLQKNALGAFEFTYTIQTSGDLSTWTTHSEPSVTITPQVNKEFLRIRIK